jgi:LacI family transcriptional regulator
MAKAAKKNVTIVQAAKLAGVSIATVSNVIGGKTERFSPATARKVMRAIERLKFRPNHNARSLVKQQSQTLGFVTHQEHGVLTKNAYRVSVLEGFLQVAVEEGYHLKLITLESGMAPERQLEDNSTDGVALILPNNEEVLRWSKKTPVPNLLVGSILSDPKLSCVGVDDFTPVYDAVSWLVGCGHERIAFISGDLRQSSACQRRDAYRKAMHDAGLVAKPEWYHEGDYHSSGGRSGAQKFFRLKNPVTAIVCSNDDTAIGVYDEAQASGIKIPEDISVIGFDDHEYAGQMRPPLTTIRQPMTEIGAIAARALIALIKGNEKRGLRHCVPGILVQRNSVSTRQR